MQARGPFSEETDESTGEGCPSSIVTVIPVKGIRGRMSVGPVPRSMRQCANVPLTFQLPETQANERLK